MSGKKSVEAAEPVREDVKPALKKPAVKQDPKPDPGCRVYIGPTVRGRVQYGAVFSSDQMAREALSIELKACPALAGLLVSMEELPGARLEVKTPGTARYVYAAQVQKDLMKH